LWVDIDARLCKSRVGLQFRQPGFYRLAALNSNEQTTQTVTYKEEAEIVA
jgi:hypothetical protein